MCNDGHESRPIAFLMHPRASTLPPSRYFKGWPRNSRYPYNCTSVSATISAVFFRANAEGIFVSITEGTHPIREGKREREKKRERERPAGPLRASKLDIGAPGTFFTVRYPSHIDRCGGNSDRCIYFRNNYSVRLQDSWTCVRASESTMNIHEDIQFFLIWLMKI